MAPYEPEKVHDVRISIILRLVVSKHLLICSKYL
jgi:hypothetical protein